MPNPSLFGVGVSKRSLAVTAQVRKNVYYDFPKPGTADRAGQAPVADIVIYGRPGIKVAFDGRGNYGASPVRGWRPVEPYLYAVFANTLYQIDNAGTRTALGNISTNSGPVYLEDNATQLCITDPATKEQWNYQIFGSSAATGQAQGTFAQVTAAGFLGSSHLGYLNNFFLNVVPGSNPLTSQSWQISNIGDCTGYAALQFDLADSDPDQLIAVAGYQNIVRLFGTQSTESWTDVGASPFPFNRMPATTQGYGLAAVGSICKFGDAGLAVLAQSRDGSPIPAILTPQGYQEIGNPDLVATFESYGTVADAIGATYQIAQHRFYQLTFPSVGAVWVFDAQTGVWCEYTSFASGVEGQFRGLYACKFNGKTLLSDFADGHVYELDVNQFTDADQVIERGLVSQHVYQNDQMLVCNWLQFDMEEGDGLPIPAGNPGQYPVLELRVSRDKGRTWSPWIQLGIGAQGDYRRRVIARRLGRARNFTFEVRHTAPTKFVLTGEAIGLEAA